MMMMREGEAGWGLTRFLGCSSVVVLEIWLAVFVSVASSGVVSALF